MGIPTSISTISRTISPPRKTEPSKGCLGSLWGAVKRIANSVEYLATVTGVAVVLAGASEGLLMTDALGVTGSLVALGALGGSAVLLSGVLVTCVRKYRSDQRREDQVNALLENSEKPNDGFGYFELV